MNIPQAGHCEQKDRAVSSPVFVMTWCMLRRLVFFGLDHGATIIGAALGARTMGDLVFAAGIAANEMLQFVGIVCTASSGLTARRFSGRKWPHDDLLGSLMRAERLRW